MSTLAQVYDADFYAWTRLQTRELRRLRGSRHNAQLDLDHLIEEVFGLGSSERNACFSQVGRVLELLLKLAYSPATAPRAGWKRSTAEARAQLALRLTTTLRQQALRHLPALYQSARQVAVHGLEEHQEADAAQHLPADCPYTLDDVLRHGWYPAPIEARG
jgi:hypothetical protein